jgi:hypothetical protein
MRYCTAAESLVLKDRISVMPGKLSSTTIGSRVDLSLDRHRECNPQYSYLSGAPGSLTYSIIGPRADPTLYRRRESPPQKSHLYHTRATLTYCHQISRTSTTAPPLRASVPEIASPWFSSISRVLSSDLEVIRHCTTAERSVPWADSLRILVCSSTSKHLT